MLVKNSLVSLLCIVGVIALNSCGGGGGSDNGGSSSSAPTKSDFEVTFSPSSLSAELVETAGALWTVQVTVTGQVNGDVYPVIEDKKGTITSQVYLEQQTATQYKAIFRVSKTLAPGKYADAIKLRLCANAACTKEYAGSPWSLPYTVNVKSHTNLVALSPIPDYHGWVSRFGGKTNTGFVPVTLDSAQFTYRWYKRLPKNKAVTDLVVENDKIFYYEGDTRDVNFSAFSVVALDQRDGSTLWTKTFDPATGGSVLNRGYGLNVADGLVSLVHYAPPRGDAYFTALNTGSGQVSVDQKAWDYAYAGSGALLEGDYFYMYGSFQSHYGIGRVSRDDGSLNWMLDGPSYDNNISREYWLPTMDSQNIYIYGQPTCNPVQYCDPAGLSVLDKQTGSKVAFVADPKSTLIDHGEIMPPIITDQGILALSGRRSSIFNYTEPSLGLYDTTAKSLKWSVNDSFLYQPVVANGVVYTVIPGPSPVSELKLVVRDLASGNVLWSLPIVNPDGLITDISDAMIITNNLLFVATANQVVAININSHEIVWEYPFGGHIAMTQSGVLVVTRNLDRTYAGDDTVVISAVTLK